LSFEYRTSLAHNPNATTIILPGTRHSKALFSQKNSQEYLSFPLPWHLQLEMFTIPTTHRLLLRLVGRDHERAFRGDDTMNAYLELQEGLGVLRLYIA
jgi:hypothetical protein